MMFYDTVKVSKGIDVNGDEGLGECIMCPCLTHFRCKFRFQQKACGFCQNKKDYELLRFFYYLCQKKTVRRFIFGIWANTKIYIDWGILMSLEKVDQFKVKAVSKCFA